MNTQDQIRALFNWFQTSKAWDHWWRKNDQPVVFWLKGVGPLFHRRDPDKYKNYNKNIHVLDCVPLNYN